MAFQHEIVVLVFRVPSWSLKLAEQLYAESTALTANANPRTIVHMERSEPGAQVRRRMADLQRELDERHPAPYERRVAVIADSPVVRGAITALRWVTGDVIQGFSSRAAKDAAAWVAHDPAHVDAIHEAYRACRRRVG